MRPTQARWKGWALVRAWVPSSRARWAPSPVGWLAIRLVGQTSSAGATARVGATAGVTAIVAVDLVASKGAAPRCQHDGHDPSALRPLPERRRGGVRPGVYPSRLLEASTKCAAL